MVVFTVPCEIAHGQFSNEYSIRIRDVDGSWPATLVQKEEVMASSEPGDGKLVGGRVIVDVVKIDGKNAIIRPRDGGGMFDRACVTVPTNVLRKEK
ncbi:MAG: hypothetical protein M1504_02875 [Candidatus Marsarchaeota archaeon]|nr:hypothetical protein [Candidatus Marsarchaeota archaeon]